MSKHGEERARERAGLKYESLERLWTRIITEGITRNDVSGKLLKFFDWMGMQHHKGNDTRIWGNHIYVIPDGALITVVPLPREHQDAVRKIQARKKEATEETETTEEKKGA